MQEQQAAAFQNDLAKIAVPFTPQEPLAGHTTFRIGGPAAFWCQPQDTAQLRNLLACCRNHAVRTYFLGNGSNTLFADEG